MKRMTGELTKRTMICEKNSAGQLGGHPHAVRNFYKNLTAPWQQPMPFPLDHVHVAPGVRGACDLLPNIAKDNGANQRRFRLDDYDDYERSNIEYSLD
jgi:hypothetical protein